MSGRIFWQDKRPFVSLTHTDPLTLLYSREADLLFSLCFVSCPYYDACVEQIIKSGNTTERKHSSPLAFFKLLNIKLIVCFIFL